LLPRPPPPPRDGGKRRQLSLCEPCYFPRAAHTSVGGHALSLSLARTPRLGSSISPDARDVCPTPRPCGDVFHLPGCAVWLIIVDSCTVRSPVAHVCLSATVTVTGWCVALTLAPCGDHELAFERHDWGGVAVFWLDCKSLQSGDPDNVACGFFVGETKQERRIQKQRVRRKARYARKLD
jgi:hypothetical protein